MQLVTYIHIAYISIHDKENMNFLLSVFIISKAMQKLFLIRRRRYLGENNFLRKHTVICMYKCKKEKRFFMPKYKKIIIYFRFLFSLSNKEK